MITQVEVSSPSRVTTSSMMSPESLMKSMYFPGKSGPMNAQSAVGHPSFAAETAMFGPVPPRVVFLDSASAVIPGFRNWSIPMIWSTVTWPYTDRKGSLRFLPPIR